MASLDELCRAIEQSPTILVLAEYLLRVCREHSDEVIRGRREHDSSKRLRATGRLAAYLLKKNPATVLSIRTRRALVELARKAVKPPGSPPLVARALAEALDTVLGDRFLTCFKMRRKEVLQAGEAYPVAVPPLLEVLGGGLSTRFQDRAELTDATSRLRLLPVTLPRHFRIRMSWTPGPALAGFQDAPLVAFGFPNGTLKEFHWDFLPEWRARFFWVRPKHPASEQWRLLLEVLERAERAGATVLLLPELCLTREVLDEVRAWFRQPGRRLSMLVAGSLHLEEHTDEQGQRVRTNTCVVLVPGGELRHHKFNPFKYSSGRRGQEFEEALAALPFELTVYWSGPWSFALLICKDFLHDEARALLARLYPSLLFIPMLSLKTTAFLKEGRGLASQTQALVFMANLGDGSNLGMTGGICLLPTQKKGSYKAPLSNGSPALQAIHLGQRDS